MTLLPDAVRDIIMGLKIDPNGSIQIHGKNWFQEKNGRIETEKLIANLANCLYHLAYIQAPLHVFAAETKPIEHVDCARVIEHANTGTTKLQNDWFVVENLSNHSVLASRHGRTRSFQPGQYFVVDGKLPVQMGARLMVQHLSGSSTQQDGFYYCFGDGFQDANDRSPLVRLYWNVRIERVAMFVKLLTSTLNRYKIPFYFKVTTASEDFRRADNAVLYVAERWFHIVSLALESVIQNLMSALDPAVPLFTKRLAAGIGFAEDPGNGESFGSSRCKLVATAIVEVAGDTENIELEKVERRFEELVAEAGLSADALFLNPGSYDKYELTLHMNSTI